MMSLEPSLLQAEQAQLSQPFLVGEVLQPLDHFGGPPLAPLQQVHVFPVLRSPDLDTGLQVGSHQRRVEQQNPLSRPAGHASLDAAQDTVGLLGCKQTLPGHVELLVNQYPHGPSLQGCSQCLHPPAYIDTKDCWDPGVGPCTWPC